MWAAVAGWGEQPGARVPGVQLTSSTPLSEHSLTVSTPALR